MGKITQIGLSVWLTSVCRIFLVSVNALFFNFSHLLTWRMSGLFPRFLFFISLIFSSEVFAAVSITTATNGTGICFRSAADGSNPSWMALGSIKITEAANTDFPLAKTNQTITLSPPAGWEFNTGVTPNISYTAAKDFTAVSVAFSGSNLVITWTTKSAAGGSNGLDEIIIGATTALQVRATNTTSLNGSIISSALSQAVSGLTAGTSAFGSLSLTTPAAPTGTAAQSFCGYTNPTVAGLAATGSSILWYAASSGGASLATGTALADATHYYASQTVSGCESDARFDVTATVTAGSTAPTSATASSATICNGQSTTLTLNGGGGGASTTIKWYTVSCGGTLAGTGNNLSVSPTTTTTYYGRYEDAAPCANNTSCQSVTITVNPLPTITLGSTTSVCVGATSADQSYSATTESPDQYSIDYNAAAQAQGFVDVVLGVLPAAPISLVVSGAVAGTYSYNVYVTNSTTGCTSSANAGTVTVGTTITLGTNPTVCTGTTSANLTYSATKGGPDQYSIDYDATAEGQGFVDQVLQALPATPIVLTVPAGATPGTYNYGLTVTNSSTGCVSATYSKTIRINAQSTDPTSATASSTTICNGDATSLTLNGGGGGTSTVIRWYTGSCGGALVGAGNGLSVTPAVTTTYYGRYEDPAPCSFTTNCESVTITVNELPTITLGTDPLVCNGATTANLTYSATTDNPHEFSIAYDAPALGQGFVDVVSDPLPASPITLSFPGTVADGAYDFILSVTNTVTGCTSGNYAKTISIGATVSIVANPTVCTGTTGASLSYSASTGGPDEYSINYDATAEGQGFVDVAYTALPASPISLVVPGAAAVNTYNYDLKVRNTVTGCESSVMPQTVTINAQSTAPTSATASATTICSGVSTTLTLTGGGGGTGAVLRWYSTTCGTGLVGTGNNLSVSPTTTTTYYGRYEDPAPCSFNTACQSVTITVNPTATVTLGTSPTVCTGTTTANLSYAGATNSPDQYSIDYNATAEGQTFSDVVWAALPATPIVLTVPAGAASGTYNYTVTVRNASLGCVGAGTARTVTINAQSTDPTSATASSSAICNGQSTTLTLNGGGGGTGTAIKWYSTSCGVGLVGTGNNLSVSPTATTTYYGRYEDPAPCSFNTACQSVTITVNPLPTITIGTSPTICVGQTSANLPYSATANSPDQYSIVYSAAAITAGFVNVTLAALPATPIVLTVPGAADATYNYNVSVKNSTTGCVSSSSTAKTVTLNPKSTDPTSATAASNTICAGGSTTLTLTGGGGGTGTVITWSTASCGGAVLGTGNSLSVSPATTTTYYGWYADPAPCSYNTACASVTVTVTPLPATPTTAVLGTSPICAGQSSTVRATSASNTINWYTVSTAGTLLGNSASATDYSVTPAATTTYYAEAKTPNGCLSAARLNVGTITVNPLPVIALGSSPTVHNGSTSATLPYSSTTNSPNQYSVDWDGTAEGVGFADVALTAHAFPANPAASRIINLVVPAYPGLSTYNADLYVKNTTTGCTSTPYPFTVTVSAIFYSKGTGSINNLSDWSLTRDGTGDPPASFTYAGDIFVYDEAGSTNLTANLTLGTNVSLEIESGTFSTTNRDLTVGGTTLIHAAGTLLDGNSSGIITLTGLVTNNGTINTTASTATGNLIFQSGVVNNGTFTAGGATFNTNNQSLTGTGAYSFANPVTVTGVTLTNSNTVTISNTAAGTLSGTGSWVQSANSILNYAGSTMTVTSFDASTCSNTVNYNASAVAQTVRVPATSYCNLIISNPAGAAITKTLAGTIDIKEDLTIQDNTTFAASTFNITIAGDWTNNSTSGTSFTNGAGTQSVTFYGNNYQIITGSMLTPFEDVVVNKGTDITYIVEAVAAGSGMSMSGHLTLTNGMLKLSHASASGQFNAAVTTPNTTGLWINSGSFSTTGSFNTTFNGLLRITTGTATFGTAAGNALIVDNNSGGSSLAILDMQGGTLNVAGRMYAHQGGAFNISGGTITTGTSGSADATNGAFHVAGTGVLSITAGTLIFQLPNTTAPGSSTTGGDLLIVSGAGAKSITGGTIQVGNASTTAGRIFMLNSAIPIWNLTINATNSPTGRLSYNNLTVNNDVLISGGTLDAATNNLDMAVRRHWTNNGGTFSGGTAKVTFDGSVPQNITGSTSTTFNAVTINNASGITFGVTNYMNGLLTLTNGLVNTTSANILTMNAGSSSTSGSAASYVNGPMNKIGTTAFVFPVGKTGVWARIGIGAPSASTTFKAEYFATAYSDITTMATTPTPVLKKVSAIEYWTLDRTAGTGNATVALYWEDATRSGINDCTDLRIGHWGGAWENNNDAVTAVGCGGAGSITTNAVVTSFSPFTFASLDEDFSINPLPIELLSFNAKPRNTEVELDWVTASEINNDYFEIERTVDGVNFEQISRVKGAGNTTKTLQYVSVDKNPYKGLAYYRLKQTDFDGNYSYSDLKAVDLSGVGNFTFNLYPNPNDGRSFNMQFTLSQTEEVLVVVYDMLGKELYSKVLITNDDGSDVYAIDPNEKLPKGVYIITATSNDKIYNKRLIVN